MFFSFIIPTYNRKAKVLRTIESVQQQIEKAQPVEIVVIDDGSADGTQQALENHPHQEGVVFVRHTENQGVTSARISGIKKARGDILVFLDSDDLLAENGLSWMTDFFESHPDMDILFGAVRSMNGKLLSRLDRCHGRVDYVHLLKAGNYGEFLPVCRKRVFGRVGFQENLWHGFEGLTWLEAARQNMSIFFSDAILRIYDSDGKDRLSGNHNLLRDAFQMAQGYGEFIRRFGVDFEKYSPERLGSILFRAALFSRLAGNKFDFQGHLDRAGISGKTISLSDHLRLWALDCLPPSVLRAVYRAYGALR